MSLIDSPIVENPSSSSDQPCLNCQGSSNHSLEECPKRDYECPHCSYKDSYEEVTGSHFKECPQLIVPCTNKGCTEKVTRISMMEHAGVCTKAIINCQYSIVGCWKKFKREERGRHENEYLKQHLKMAVKGIKDLKERPPQPAMAEGELATVVLKVKDFSELKQQGQHWISPTFYTSVGGYKLVMVFFPNGYGEDEGTYISCFVCLLPGEYDTILEWPVKGEVTVELLNQLQDDNHTTVTLTIEEDNEFYQVDEEDIENIEEDLPGVGQSNFIHQSHLEYDPELNVQYLKDDSVYFRVAITKLLTRPAKPWLMTTH